ncbi:MAG TPA: hypothetical protein VFD13_04000 [Candidatus Kapabacteria bacterium]|nr:hypothetical protein [Candidatus Kapabacteria bacterium]
MIQLLLHKLETTGSGGVGVGGPTPCTDGFTYVATYAQECWEELLDGNGNPYYVPCGAGTDYCELDCKYCKNTDGSWNITCTSTNHDDGTCNPLPTPDVWVVGTCYHVAPCEVDN